MQKPLLLTCTKCTKVAHKIPIRKWHLSEKERTSCAGMEVTDCALWRSLSCKAELAKVFMAGTFHQDEHFPVQCFPYSHNAHFSPCLPEFRSVSVTRPSAVWKAFSFFFWWQMDEVQILVVNQQWNFTIHCLCCLLSCINYLKGRTLMGRDSFPYAYNF